MFDEQKEGRGDLLSLHRVQLLLLHIIFLREFKHWFQTAVKMTPAFLKALIRK